MKITVKILALGLLFASLNTFAQNDKTAQEPASKAATSAPTNKIPVADYYEGGQEAMYEYIHKELQYPIMAKRNRIQGQCIIGFTLNEDGSTTNFKILKNIGGGCGEEALRVVQLLKFKSPGYSMVSSIPVNFKL